MKKTALLLGASGATGNQLLKLLVKDSRYEKIILFSRSKNNFAHPKIEEHIINLFELEKHKNIFIADEVYCCIGTTKAKTPDKNTYREIDFGIPATVAKLAKENNIPAFIVVSALGANKNSAIFYNRTKGEMQEDVLKQNIFKTHILQPSLIIAQRKDSRILETVFSGIMYLINPILFGNAARYRSIKADTIAKAMLWLANNNYPDKIVKSEEIQKIANFKD